MSPLAITSGRHASPSRCSRSLTQRMRDERLRVLRQVVSRHAHTLGRQPVDVCRKGREERIDTRTAHATGTAHRWVEDVEMGHGFIPHSYMAPNSALNRFIADGTMQ